MELKLWTYPFRKTYYLTHPWMFLKDTYWNFRNWWHRGKYGFAYVDAWNWCDWWTKVGAEALRYIADHGNGYPGIDPWNTHKQWKEYLKNTATKLESCVISHTDDENEFSKEFEEMVDRCTRTEDNKMWLDMTPENENKKKKYFNRIKELCEERVEARRQFFNELAENLDRYWD